MFDVIKRSIKSIVPILSDTHMVTSLGVRMRKPIDKNGLWIGWTGEEVAEHLSAVRKYTIPHKEIKKTLKEDVSGGCGRS